MKDPHVVSFSPMHHWTEHNIRVHVFTCVLALQTAHLMRRTAALSGQRLSVRDLLAQLEGIGETVLIYPSAGGRPKARRMTTELTADQRGLYEIFETSQAGTPKLGHTPKRANEAHLTSRNSQSASRSSETPASAPWRDQRLDPGRVVHFAVRAGRRRTCPGAADRVRLDQQ